MSVRQVQHRQRRQERRSRELADLKREVHRLEQVESRQEEDLEHARSIRPKKARLQLPEPDLEGQASGIQCSCGCADMRIVDLGDHGRYACCPCCKAKHKL